ncbi:MAG: carboxypeptidase regulatory-like domain-containing protein [Planctomycetota bacterium]
MIPDRRAYSAYARGDAAHRQPAPRAGAIPAARGGALRIVARGRGGLFPMVLWAGVALPCSAIAALQLGSGGEERGEKVAIVTGQITNAVGAGLIDVTVMVFRKGMEGARGEEIGSAKTDEYGDFRVEAVHPGECDVIVVLGKPQFAEHTATVHLNPTKPPPFLGEALAGGLSLQGRVESVLEGKPVSGAKVLLRSVAQDWQADTDERGAFTLAGIAPGEGELIVEAVGFGRERRIIPRLEEASDLVVAVKPERIVRLSIVDEAQQPIAGATIEAVDQARNDFRAVVSDEAGSVVLRGVHFDARELTARITHEGYVSSEGFDRRIVTPADTTESTHVFVLPRAGQVEGTVRSAATGDAVYGARVVVGESGEDSPRAWSEPNGRFAVRGVAPGKAPVTVYMAGFSPDLREVEVTTGSATTADFRLEVSEALVGVVVDQDDKPIAGAEVMVSSWRGYKTMGLRSRTDEQGRFSLEDAPGDEFEAVVLAPRGKLLRRMMGADRKTAVPLVVEVRADEDGARKGLVVGEPAPIVELMTLDGRKIALADLKGKTVVLDFWATWCGPCVAEIPRLAELQKRYGLREDFTMISVSRDVDVDELRGFLKSRGEMSWVQAHDGDVGAAADAFRVKWIPWVVVVDAEGKIAANGAPPSEVEALLDERLKKP